MTDEQIVTLLRSLRALAMIPYPHPEHSRGHPALVFALGNIAGVATKALAEYERPIEPKVSRETPGG
jgi:hypothetical protein